MSFALIRKCYVRNWNITKFCDIVTDDFRFRFSVEKGISFSSAFSFTSENEKNAFSVGLYIKLFQITPYVNDFQTFNNPGSGQPVGASKN